MRRRHVVGLIALLAGAAALTAGPAYAKEPKPTAFLEATPAVVPSRGTTTLTIYGVWGAKECTLSANKEVAGLPVTFPCESGTIERKLTMPANRTQGPLKYRLKLRAINAEGRASHAAKARVSVESETFTVDMLQRLQGETAYTHNIVFGKAPLTVEYEILVTNIGEEVPVQVDSIQDLLVPGCQTFAPQQPEVKRGEREVVEATCSHTIATPHEYFTNEATVRGKFFPHHQAEFFEVERVATAYAE